MFERAREIDAISLKRFEFVRTEQWMKLCDVFESHDALICPTCPIPAPQAELTDDDIWAVSETGKVSTSDMTAVFNNIAQCPALSVPSGWTTDGLPTAIQIIGHRGDDLGVLCIGAAVQKYRPWSNRRPEI